MPILQLFTFEGCANRLQFWVTVLVLSLIDGLLYGVFQKLHFPEDSPSQMISAAAFGLVAFVSLWILLSIIARRWHDMNRSPFWTLLAVIPFLGGAIILVWLGFWPSRSSPHRVRKVRTRRFVT